jgi:hypothetical protein
LDARQSAVSSDPRGNHHPLPTPRDGHPPHYAGIDPRGIALLSRR